MAAIDNRKLDMIAQDVASTIAWQAESPQSDGTLMLGGQRWHCVTQDGASLLFHRPESGARVRVRITAEEY